jgi:RecB family endonuclease NucS
MPVARAPISVREVLRRRKFESAIEDLLFAYPYLISSELSRPLRQTALNPNSRCDLLFLFARRASVVEIKRGVIDASAVTQIQRYLKSLSKNHQNLNGYLVGSDITPVADRAIKRSHWKINFKALNRDIPLQISICTDCRVARDHRISACICGKLTVL